jgi:hypothetical protein
MSHFKAIDGDRARIRWTGAPYTAALFPAALHKQAEINGGAEALTFTGVQMELSVYHRPVSDCCDVKAQSVTRRNEKRIQILLRKLLPDGRD